MVDSNCYQGYLMAGLCYEKLENVEKSIENYELAHETKPEEALPNKQLYLIYKKEKEFQKAAEYVENIVDILEPKTDKIEQYSDYAMKLLEVYEYSMDIQKAYAFFLKVIERKDLKDQVKAEACRVYFKLVMEDHKLEFSLQLWNNK
ncbi:hypothetical protein PPERSA_07546 [Pseudocohnilembus persalinus]|uniref:Uncharacterized protein n=1 Tax=Pseudocohnilembus persalinus TaxID=266149 RepID=A0A0V0QZV0_PSEPJ|nr:hypothetical protein PPERSA_07546 [Pseudocohnilembus persalinus]|eukprot:KRX07796.1 hypothetical protein PPERSA_07546 [Pseudocohnilembus persalinus]